MIRKFILASAVSLALLPGSSTGLGLGGIRTESALNEPFVGEIELNDAVPDELDTVKVTLASPDEFAKAGASRPHFLTKFRFSPQISPRGTAVVRVTSPEPIREPYLDFLVEVSWPKGRLVKEYTVLLDPPVTTSRSAPRVERPATGAAPAARLQSENKPLPIQRSAPPTHDAAGYPLRYGPVEPGEGLWQIARDISPPDASLAQTAMAIYRNNQNAFIGGDINKLKLGARLTIPTPDELHAMDQAAAEREFETALRGGRVTSTPITDVARVAQPTDRLEIAPAGPSSDPPASAPPREAGAAEPEEIGVMRHELLLVQEMGESNRQETEELRARIRELEAQLADIRKLLELRNEQLAQIQASVVEAAKPVRDPSGENTSEGEAEKIAGTDSDRAGTKPPDADQPGSRTPPLVSDVAAPPEAALERPRDAAKPEPVVTEVQAEAPFWQSLPLPALGAAAGVPFLLLIAGLVIVHRRRRLAEALPAGGFAQELPLATEIPAARAAGIEPGVAKAASDEVAPIAAMPAPLSDFSNLHDETDEDDILSEADVYIAYGRYREAELLLANEIANAPERIDLKLKLAEAYAGARNGQRLEETITELREAGADRQHPQQWQRLTAMVRELRGAAGPVSGAAREDRGAASFATESKPPSEWDADSPFEAGSEPSAQSALAQGPESKRPVAAGSPSPMPSSQDLELDVDDFSLVTSQLMPPEGDLAGESGASALEKELEGLEELDSLRFDELTEQGSRSVQTSSVTARAGGSGQPSELTVDSLDLTPLGERGMGSDALSSQWQTDSGLWDEVATKIDLARAYMEMEDPDAARVILEEVVEEGNEEQRAEANEMLSRLR